MTKRCIFVIENDDTLSSYIAELRSEYEVETATDARSAVSKVTNYLQSGVRIDVFMIDLMMPKQGIRELATSDNHDNHRTGYYLHTYFKNEFKNRNQKYPPVIFVTALNDAAFLEKIEQEPGVSVLRKRHLMSIETISNRIRNIFYPDTNKMNGKMT